MEAWCPRQQVPGIVFWGGKCIIMKAGAGRKSTANIKSLRKQLKCHCFSSSAPIPDSFFISPFLCFHTSFQMIFYAKKIPSVFLFCSLSEGFSRWITWGLAMWIRCVSSSCSSTSRFLVGAKRRKKEKSSGSAEDKMSDYTWIGRDYPYTKKRLSHSACTQHAETTGRGFKVDTATNKQRRRWLWGCLRFKSQLKMTI